jgi:integrase
LRGPTSFADPAVKLARAASDTPGAAYSNGKHSCIFRRDGRAIDKHVTPHRLRASVATLLRDAGMPLDRVQKFLRNKRITTTQIYADASLCGMSENYLRAFGGKRVVGSERSRKNTQVDGQ